jgi:hypothetical protein
MPSTDHWFDFFRKNGFENGELRTKKVNEAVELLCRPGNVFNASENKKSSENLELFTLVPYIGKFSNQFLLDISLLYALKPLFTEATSLKRR